jgi:hypothetical protein
MRHRPAYVKDEHLKHLDELSESGVMNMYGSGRNLQLEFGLTKSEAKETVLYWMDSFNERNPQ